MSTEGRKTRDKRGKGMKGWGRKEEEIKGKKEGGRKKKWERERRETMRNENEEFPKKGRYTDAWCAARTGRMCKECADTEDS